MKFFMVHAPELMFHDIDPGNPLDEESCKEFLARHGLDGGDADKFIADSVPGDFVSRKDITVVRLGVWWIT